MAFLFPVLSVQQETNCCQELSGALQGGAAAPGEGRQQAEVGALDASGHCNHHGLGEPGGSPGKRDGPGVGGAEEGSLQVSMRVGPGMGTVAVEVGRCFGLLSVFESTSAQMLPSVQLQSYIHMQGGSAAQRSGRWVPRTGRLGLGVAM